MALDLWFDYGIIPKRHAGDDEHQVYAKTHCRIVAGLFLR
jgi:hypothetical protein